MPTNENLTNEHPTFVTHLECGMEGDHYEADTLHGLSKAGKPLLVRYDLDAIKNTITKEDLANRPADLWRYREFLPVRKKENIVSLGEIHTPIIPLPKLAAGKGELLVKDEGRLPTGSFKARGLCMAVSMAKELGITKVAMPTNGNAGAALAAYGSRAGMESYIFCPDDTPTINIREIAAQGAKVWSVNGLINDCGRIVGQGKEAMRWFDFSTLKEPYRIEGKKTMGLELADQLGWKVPDVIFYPTGGGTGLIGMWKAFNELTKIGWLNGKLPRMVAVQATGCAPIVKAYEDGIEHAPLWQNAHTVAAGIRVPIAVGDFLILRAIRESRGFAIAVDDNSISAGLDEVSKKEGLLLCPEGAATYAAYRQSLEKGLISPDETAVLFNCATGLKYELPPADDTLDCTLPINYQELG
ncbi:MAG: threonine synthase [Opitutales bacterium]|jgi:threonine synthase|nr:threonine synthase [Opitutales bacterium]MBT5813127.1 threonine synthase [Opitutales bacterium]MBT6379175.1 threonine synthase [Opitutales bacterium]